MIKFIFLFTIILNWANLAFAHDFAVYPTPMHTPTSLFEDKNAKITTLGQFHGNVVIVNFCATWCKPCLVEMPSLNKLKQEYSSLGLKIVPILKDYSEVSKARSFYRIHKLKELEYFIDKDLLTAQSFNVSAIPESFILNRQGKLVAYVSGSINWLDASNVKFIETLLEQGQ